MAEQEGELTFWEHLDVLRSSLIKMIVVAVGAGLVAFGFKDQLFDIVLAPKNSDFITYRLLGAEPFSIQLVNVGLTEQFMIHMKTAIYFGILVASPYIIYLLYKFIAPALYTNERHYAVRLVGGGYVMFIVGILVNYFLIFPLTVRFLGTYQVDEQVKTMLSLQSYMDTMLTMSIVFGVVFEIPIISWLLALFGLIKAKWMSQYRRHAVVAILVLAAFITPTSDIFTLLVVSLPIWLLYEVSIIIVRVTPPLRSHSLNLEGDEEEETEDVEQKAELPSPEETATEETAHEEVNTETTSENKTPEEEEPAAVAVPAPRKKKAKAAAEAALRKSRKRARKHKR